MVPGDADEIAGTSINLRLQIAADNYNDHRIVQLADDGMTSFTHCLVLFKELDIHFL